MSLLSLVNFSSSRKPHWNVLLKNNKNSNLDIVLECSEKVVIYNTFLDATVCIQTKNRKQKHLYIKPCLNVTYVLKPKTENKNITQDYMIICQFLYFYNLPFAFINYTFCFNSISMGLCWIFSSFQHETLWITFQVSCNFSSITFFDLNSLTSFVKASAFLVIASEAFFSFRSARSILCLLRALQTECLNSLVIVINWGDNSFETKWSWIILWRINEIHFIELQKQLTVLPSQDIAFTLLIYRPPLLVRLDLVGPGYQLNS